MKAGLGSKIRLHNLTSPLSTFVGRAREIAEVKQLLAFHRLVTLTGAGGSGKTRLSLKVAGELLNEFEQGIWLVELASISDPALVSQTIASVLNIREQAGQLLLNALVDVLAGRETLLILDNCEPLVSACAQVAENSAH
jgi:non-specific serine/threonine protein kinase